MGIRKAAPEDHDAIVHLLDQLGYPNTDSFLAKKIQLLNNDVDAKLMVYEKNSRVIALIALDIIKQLALESDRAHITYFVIDDRYRHQGIGKEMEEFCVNWAKEKSCDGIELHCAERRNSAHEFYERCGYLESPKYFIKKIK